jgi:phosphoribosylformylglycinamidine (FGAM) synthase-like amidotransferase family enzyme
MSEVRVLVLRAAGINCDEETMHCWRLAGAKPTLVHVNGLAETPSILRDYSIVTIPGGFSYGDDVGAGTILAQRILQTVADPLREFVDRGGGVLGICNGFQVMVKMGLLPGGDFGRDQVTVTYNDSARFEARWVRLEVATDKCPFLAQTHDASKARSGERQDAGLRKGANSRQSVLELPVEHAEGKVVTASDAVARRLLECGQVALRYVDAGGNHDQYPANPNGSVLGIAGLCDPTGRVFGLMPHPDRHFDRTQHPAWTSRRSESAPDGLTIFANAVSHWST